MPDEIARRGSLARAELGAGSIEWSGPKATTIGSDTTDVLSVNSLPIEQSALLEVLQQWRRSLGTDAQIHLIERTRLERSSTWISTIRSRLGLGVEQFERDVVAAIRQVGWTITAIDRIDVELDGERQRWVDLRATDVVGQVEREMN
ncbi:MAG: hypothetical protein R8J94_07045 [Acidimicrobiia bacterium]|nr:hypothetical protein [Acidimicrobiia bacterium]